MSTIKLKTKLVKGHFSLTLKQEQKNLVDYIVDELKGLSADNLKLDPDFLKYLAKVIENQVKKTTEDSAETKPSKMDILMEILKRLFPHIKDEEVVACKGIKEFLLKQGLVKKVALSKIMKFYLKQKFLNGLRWIVEGSYYLLTNKYLSATINSYNLSRFILQNYSQVTMYNQSSLLNQYVLYPVLINLIEHKAIVLIILAFV